MANSFNDRDDDFETASVGHDPFYKFLVLEIKHLRESIQNVERKVDGVQTVLQGEEGLITRMKLLEQQKKDEEKQTKSALTGVSLFVSIVAVLFSIFKSDHSG